jgi:integrase
MSVRMTFDDMLNAYLKYRKQSGLKESTIFGLIQFHRDCKKQFSGETNLTESMIGRWCAKRQTETVASNRSRIYPVIGFLRYVQARGWLDFDIPDLPKVKRNNPVPHAFTEEELQNFFRACDELPDGRTMNVKLKKIEVPVFFRLLFSSGIRTTEGRLLRKENVNLQTGVIAVRYTKGYNEHIVVLHDSMKNLLVRYDNVIGRLMPNRKYFFPAVHDKCHWNQWVSDEFSEMWFKYNTAKTVPYALRHNYAIENINKWSNTGYEIQDKLVALSKSMGHSTLQSTLYYYSLVPKLYKTIEELSGDTFNRLIPDLPDDEE